jgi:hypothetical protein
MAPRSSQPTAKAAEVQFTRPSHGGQYTAAGTGAEVPGTSNAGRSTPTSAQTLRLSSLAGAHVQKCVRHSYARGKIKLGLRIRIFLYASFPGVYAPIFALKRWRAGRTASQ